MKNLEEEDYGFRLGVRFDKFPLEVEEIPLGPLCIVCSVIGGGIHLSLAQIIASKLNILLSDSIILVIWIVLGIILGAVMPIKLVFWLDDQIEKDRRELQ